MIQPKYMTKLTKIKFEIFCHEYKIVYPTLLEIETQRDN